MNGRKIEMAKELQITIMVGFYSLFAWGFSQVAGSFWPLWCCWAHLASRMMIFLSKETPDAKKQKLTNAWGARLGSYLLIFLVWFVWGGALRLPLPRFGLTPEVLSALNLDDKIAHIIGFGFLYFSTMGLLHLTGLAYKGKVKFEDRRGS